MEFGGFTKSFDVAQLVLYVFWAFFAGVVYYLQREQHREGYPMDPGRPNGPKTTGWPLVKPKTYKMRHGPDMVAPNPNRPDGEYSFEPGNRWSGGNIVPKGDPLLAGVGPGGWAMRADEPDLTYEGTPKIVPLRVAKEYNVAKQNVDPRGMQVLCADKESAGEVCDMWVDQSESIFRFIEVALKDTGTRVLIPMNFARINKNGVHVNALMSHHFANVPKTRNPEQITLLEEEKIMGYFGAGLLYAHPSRQDPLL
ncbi:photosynthetic reaction center subunit H [Rhodoferax sp. 4810]|nr:photosynthetic reaction center subunit H [Rhodoferax jenense]